jgi:predicted small secreted protein
MKNTAKVLQRTAGLLLLLAATILFTGCRNTAEGVGQDM